MPKTTEPQAPPAEILAKLELIKDANPYYCRSAVFRKSDGNMIEGNWVVYREQYKDTEWHLTQIITTDARNIVKTTSGVNFSTNRSHTYIATKRIGDNSSYAELWSIDGIIECHQIKLAKDAATQRERNLQNLQYFVNCLKAHEHAELVQELLELLKSKGVME